jgi:uncharacterized protein (DUF736 family)
MIIGKFQQDDGEYVGTIPSVATYPVRIIPIDLKGIDYKVVSAEGVEVGIGWRKTSKEKGTAYLSVLLDTPVLPAAANCALFEQKDGSYDLVWDRKKPKAEQATA